MEHWAKMGERYLTDFLQFPKMLPNKIFRWLGFILMDIGDKLNVIKTFRRHPVYKKIKHCSKIKLSVKDLFGKPLSTSVQQTTC